MEDEDVHQCSFATSRKTCEYANDASNPRGDRWQEYLTIECVECDGNDAHDKQEQLPRREPHGLVCTARSLDVVRSQ